MRSIIDVVRNFKQNWTEELSATAIAQACREEGMSWRNTTLNPIVSSLAPSNDAPNPTKC